ncbi:MAG TPA: ThiF family adenylyltransferase [Steroidobacteraceae bacterium]|nr:ThiF family adenylyltransferase [Steroidobacteraceae bacterium]
MASFSLTRERIDPTALRQQLADPAAGGFASFEGWVRNHNEGLPVRHLEYEAFEPLAIREGERIIAEAVARFAVEHAACVHRTGDLPIGEMAVWVGVSARHRHEAFLACRYIIDEVKQRLPIWKKEHYENGDSGWVNCERCAEHTSHAHEPKHAVHWDGPMHVAQHAHAAHVEPRPSPPTLLPDYSRQMALREVGASGQARLRASRVLIVGCGGLAVPVVGYLAGAGIGRLGLVDSDRLEPSNLHRQTMYALSDVGRLKAELAAERVRALNPDVDVRAHAVRLGAGNASELISQYELVIDCTDNFTTKFLLNDFCVQLGKPVVFSSVYQYEGQLQVVRPARPGESGTGSGACLRCVWPEATRDGIVGNCAEAGVLGPVPGIFGGLQAFEALKLLLDLPGQLADELLVLDLLTLSISRVRTRRASSCPEHANSRAEAARAEALRAQSICAQDLEVEFDSLEQALEAGFEIVDIREPQEVSETPAPVTRIRHVPLAVLLHGQPPFQPTGKSLLMCASGRRSLAATQELRSRGLEEVYSLRGGLLALRARLNT